MANEKDKLKKKVEVEDNYDYLMDPIDRYLADEKKKQQEQQEQKDDE